MAETRNLRVSWVQGRSYLDRKGFVYECIGVTDNGYAVFLAKKADGTVAIAGRDPYGRYTKNHGPHDYDIVLETT